MRVYSPQSREEDPWGQARMDLEWKAAPPQFGAQATFDFEAVEDRALTGYSITPLDRSETPTPKSDVLRGQADTPVVEDTRAIKNARTSR